MSNVETGQYTARVQDKTDGKVEAACARESASQHCLNEVASIATPGSSERPDIKSGLFDEKAPLSHFGNVSDDVYRSGRPVGEDGVKQAVEKVWNDSQFDPAEAAKTAIIDLRGAAPGQYFQQNEDEVNAEVKNSEQLGITHARFPMLTHEHQSPQFIQSVLDYIDQQKSQGDRVLIHCFHGTDRTGTIAAAYQLTHDPQMKELLKSNPDEAFKQGLKSMTDNGFSPPLFPELTQSLKDFVSWKHAQLTEHASVNTSKSSQVAEFIEVPSLWRAA